MCSSDLSVMNDTMIMDLDILNIHCDSVDDTLEQVGEHLGIKETPFNLMLNTLEMILKISKKIQLSLIHQQEQLLQSLIMLQEFFMKVLR